MSSVVPPLDMTNLDSDRYRNKGVELSEATNTTVSRVTSFFSRYQLFFYGFAAGVAATIVGSKVRDTFESHSSY
jgi:hypothetical protein